MVSGFEKLLSSREMQDAKLTHVLDLSGQNLTLLPPDIGNLTYLRKLILDGNELRSLPREICRLTNLETLTLNGNRLTDTETALPPEIGKLTRAPVK